MPADSRTFSESWYRIADQRIRLRPVAQAHVQYYRGQQWHVLRDPFSNRFFRLRPAAYDFIARLDDRHTVEQVWEDSLKRNPDDAPGQEEVIQLLSQLYHANLLQYDLPTDSEDLFKRYRETRRRETQSRLLNIMFARFPLLDPDHLIGWFMPLARLLISLPGALLWLAAVGVALKVAMDHFDALRVQAEGILAPGNLPLLYAALVIIKTCHEFGHSFVCRRFGGEVHTMGIMLLLFTPLPYMDATSAWAFRNRWARVLVGASGMLVEVFIAACATVVWARTGPGVIHSLAYNILFIASVSTILFNANPLIRFDGYYILSDLLDIPNLYDRAWRQLVYVVETYLFGCRNVEPQTHKRGEAVWLCVYGVLSRVYRVLIFTRILLFVADRFLLAGIIMFAVCVISWVCVPLFQFSRYLASSPRLDRVRPRAVTVTAAALVLLVVVFHHIPYPERFRCPGILEASQYSDVITRAPGSLKTILARPGEPVRTGQPLVLLENPELPLQLAEVEAKIRETEALLRYALDQQPADLTPLRQRLGVIHKQRQSLLMQQDALRILARHDGIWVAPDIEHLQGMWLPRGAGLGSLVNPQHFRFTAVVTQQEASRLFAGRIRKADVRLRGSSSALLTTREQSIIAVEQTLLPSAALGWRGGGNIAIDPTDPSGRRTAEPFFQVQTMVDAHPQVAFMHGRTGTIRFELPPTPLLQQWLRRLRQLLQKRYRI